MAPLQPFTPLVETPKRDEILSRSANTSVTSCATENYQGFAQKRKALPARPGTVGEIIDATRPDRISKVMLQSKLYKVWHHGRTVLLGDACHKVLPFAGFAWTIGGRVIGAEAGHEDFRSFSFAEWFPEHASDVCDLVRDYNMPNYNGSYKKDEHYKNPSLSNVAHPYEYNHFGELASASD
ncbi:hypothetical protein BGZ76_007299, partial [Entomortierella beljakovae]